MEVGLPARTPGTAVDMTRLDKVIDYPARDMTITVQAGIRVSRLQEILASEGQTLPLDIPWPDKATVGGLLACNVSGSRRLAHGTPRDFVIGLTVVDDHGKLTKSGGRVVKNVAGYDMAKLHIGAHGTLGPMAQVTLKVRPLASKHESGRLSRANSGVGYVSSEPVRVDSVEAVNCRLLAT